MSSGGMSRFSRAITLGGLLLAAPLLGGCGAATQNVRAFRAYANEDPNINVAIDRVEDMAITLELVDRILLQQSYTPGDMWPRRLGMTDAQFRDIKAELREKYPYSGLENAEVPILKCYRYHLEHALVEYAPPPEKAKYASLFDAVGALNPRTKDIKKHWIAYRDATTKLAQATEDEERISGELLSLSEAARKPREAELGVARDKTLRAKSELLYATDAINNDTENLKSDAELASGDRQQIARDAFYALSVAFRIELEALALIPIITIQAVRAIPNVGNGKTFKPHGTLLKQIWQMPSYVSGIKQSFLRQADLLERMTGALAQALKTDVNKSPGMELQESVVDQIVGITLDSFRIDLKAGAEMFIYSSIGTPDRNDDYDFRGRKFKLDYRIQPIILAQARLDIVLDWIRMPGAANLGFGYSTDRVYKSGGDLENTTLSKQLGIEGVASDVLEAGMGLVGIRSSAKIATFTNGRVDQVQATDVTSSVGSAPLRLKYTQVDVGYDILWLLRDDQIKAYMEELVVGGRYYRYSLPRIVYELIDTSTTPGQEKFTFFRETPPQLLTTEFWMLSVSGRFGQGEAPRWSPYLDLNFAGGVGPSRFYFLADPNAPDVATNRVNAREAAVGLVGGGALGLRWRLLPRGSRIRLDLRAEYRGNALYTIVTRDETANGRALRTDFGQFDVFHGPTIGIRGSL